MHTKTVRGREYEYEMQDVKVPGEKYLHRREVYVKPVDRRQPKIMERLEPYDVRMITSAWKGGISVERIAGYVKAATGHRPANQTIYSYFRKRGIKREKRKSRKSHTSSFNSMKTVL